MRQSCLTTAYLAQQWDISPSTVRKYFKLGLIPESFKGNGKYYTASQNPEKPDIIAIKIALVLCVSQASPNVNEETKDKVRHDLRYLNKIPYLQSIDFIQQSEHPGSGQFELTENGADFLEGIQQNTFLRYIGDYFKDLTQNGVIAIEAFGFRIELHRGGDNRRNRKDNNKDKKKSRNKNDKRDNDGTQDDEINEADDNQNGIFD